MRISYRLLSWYAITDPVYDIVDIVTDIQSAVGAELQRQRHNALREEGKPAGYAVIGISIRN
jgi:hypothetical protein